MNKKKLKSIGIIAILVICTISYFSFAYRESTINKGFPIPVGAHVTNFDSVNKFEEYDWTHASFENGLPFYYKSAIRLWGWKGKPGEMGETIYQKGEAKIEVISNSESFFIGGRTNEE